MEILNLGTFRQERLFHGKGACPVGSVTAGYIGGGQNLCRRP